MRVLIALAMYLSAMGVRAAAAEGEPADEGVVIPDKELTEEARGYVGAKLAVWTDALRGRVKELARERRELSRRVSRKPVPRTLHGKPNPQYESTMRRRREEDEARAKRKAAVTQEWKDCRKAVAALKSTAGKVKTADAATVQAALEMCLPPLGSFERGTAGRLGKASVQSVETETDAVAVVVVRGKRQRVWLRGWPTGDWYDDKVVELGAVLVKGVHRQWGNTYPLLEPLTIYTLLELGEGETF